MNPSASPGFEVFSDFESEVLDVCDLPDPLQTCTQQQYQQQEVLDAQSLDQDLPPYSQSIDITQNQPANPILLEIQPQIVSQAPFENLHQEEITPNSDAQNELKHLQAVLPELEYQVEATTPGTQRPRESLQLNPLLHTEWQPGQSEHESNQTKLLELCDAEGITLIPDSQYQDMVMEAHRRQSSMEKSPPSQLVTEFSDQPALSQRFELDNAHTEDMDADEIRSNVPPEKPKQQKPRPKVPQSTDQNTENRKIIVKKRNKNPNRTLTVGSSHNVNSSNALRTAHSEAKMECPSCKSQFSDSREVRRHFRMIHVGTDTQANICQECLQPCQNSNKFRRHWESAHVGELIYVCPLCGARFGKQRNLSWHLTKMHLEKPTPNENHQDPQPQDL